MMLFLAFFLASITHLHATPLIADDSFTYAKASTHMEYIADTDQTLSIETVQNAQWHAMSSSNLGGLNHYPSWTKLTLKNGSNNPKQFVIKNPRACMDEIEMYLFQNDTMVHKTLGDQFPIETRTIPHRYSAEFVNLEPHEEVQIITKLRNTIGSTEGEWEIFERKGFVHFTIVETLWWGIFIGVYLALFVYALPILFALHDKVLSFVFTLYSLSSIGHQLCSNGILYSFGLYGDTLNIITLLFYILFYIFTVLLILRFLKIIHHKKVLSHSLRIILGLLIIEVFFTFLCFLEPKIIRYLAFMTLCLGFLSLLIWFLLLKNFSHSKTNKIIFYIFIGYTAIFIGHLYQLLVTIGLLEMNFVSIYSVSIGSIIEMYCFSLGIAQYIKHMRHEKSQQDQLLDFQMRFASIGRVIGNISHQWKIPIVRAGALLTHIEALIHFQKKSTLNEIANIIPQIRSHFIFMQNSIDEFYFLYSRNTHKATFKLLNVINDVWAILSSKVSHSNMKLYVKDLHDVTLHSFEYSFSHIFIILIDNAIDAAKARAIHNPKISIEIFQENEITTIVFEDNCGGILQKPIHSIFDIDISTKYAHKENGGLGLSIVKLLVHDKFRGTITASNTLEGARFTLTIPLLMEKDSHE